MAGLPRGEAGREVFTRYVAPSSDIRRDGGDCCRNENKHHYNQAGKKLTACLEGLAESFPPNRESTETFASRSDRLFRSIIGPP